MMFLAMMLAAPPGFLPSHFDEHVREEWHEGCRFVINLPPKFDLAKPVRLILFATPNGNTIEETLGNAGTGRYDIQHIAAQVRTLRETEPNTVLVVLEAQGLTWPAYRAKYKDNPERIRTIVDGIITRLAAKDVRVTLTGHSGGGSFTSGFLNAHDTIPSFVDRIAYLDSNYSVEDAHCDKLLAWLKADKARKLIVLAYDDREITLDGKKVVSATGGTWRATDRMLARMKSQVEFQTTTPDPWLRNTALDGRIDFRRHTNPANKILHTVLVGEMNGLLFVEGHQAVPGEPRAYAKHIQPVSGFPPRTDAMTTGSAFANEVKSLDKAAREDKIREQLLAGNVPQFLRTFTTVTAKRKDAAGQEHEISVDVMPDYLSIGSDADFLRMPMTPQTATTAAMAFGCVLPTTAMVDMIHAAAKEKLEPKPLGEPRESVDQFFNHHRIIEAQRTGKLGDLVSGVKKDIVWSNRIAEKPRRLALYGWHQEGKPIQPLTIVHVDHYVDYSHGVRLVKRTVLVDGKPKDIRDIVRDPNLAPLLSSDGVLKVAGYE